MPRVEINGRVVEFASTPTPEDIDHVAGSLGGAVAGGPGTPGGTAAGQIIAQSPPDNSPGLGTAALEMVGGTGGEALYGPLGSGIGTVVGGTVGDIGAGRGLSLGRTAERFASGAIVPPVVGKGLKMGGQLLGAGTRAIAEHLPSFAEFAERIAPGVMRRGSRALKATGDLGDIPAETVIERFRQWSGKVFDHVNGLAGDAPVVPTATLKASAEGIGSLPGMTKAEQQAFKEAMSADAVSFKTARTLESGFRRLARTRLGQKAMGDAVTHQWNTLADAVGSDLETFMATPEAAESGVGQALTAAKKTYQEGKQAIDATKIYRMAFTPGGEFNARRFASKIQNLDAKGILSRVVGADRAADLRTLAEEFGKQTEPSHLLAGRTGRTIARVTPVAAALGGEEAYRRGSLGPGGLGTAALMLSALHPTGRALMSPLIGQGTAAALRQAPSPADFLNWLRSQPPVP